MDFQVRDHLELGASLDLIDFETAAEVAGSKFYYMRRAGAMALDFSEIHPRHVLLSNARMAMVERVLHT